MQLIPFPRANWFWISIEVCIGGKHFCYRTCALFWNKICDCLAFCCSWWGTYYKKFDAQRDQCSDKGNRFAYCFIEPSLWYETILYLINDGKSCSLLLNMGYVQELPNPVYLFQGIVLRRGAKGTGMKSIELALSMCDIIDMYGFTVDPGYTEWWVMDGYNTEFF